MGTFATLLQKQRAYFFDGEPKDVEFRIEQIKKLKSMIKENEQEILTALKQDLNKSEHEAFLTEISYLYSEINEVLKNIRKWVKPVKVRTTLTNVGSKSMIYRVPYGVTLIIAPWNYPFQLAIAPLIGAIAAGNCAVIKPSEHTPHTSRLVHQLISKHFDEKYVAVVEGEVETSQALLEERFDHIFFTGSVEVGKLVMEAAAKYLTPVTLELGGKSPTIIHDDANIDLAAKRIVWGKFINAGQTCIAPDYLLVQETVKTAFLKKLVHYIEEMYGDETMLADRYPTIVNEKHVDRLESYLYNGTVLHGGHIDKDKRWVAPTILDDVQLDSPVMKEEIFGPILPVLTYKTIEQAIDIIRDRPNPLALYLFTEDRQLQETIIEQVSFGGGCINDTVYHFASPDMPFGGVGESGHGAYHGERSFLTFSHEKSILRQTTKFDIPLRYLHKKGTYALVKKLLS
ncbi:aldehyde dehydrogenase [Bacillus alkalicellulosilyticus]|uniref:aldehyde dehydrogenase n=1 Tax=Alkalihalobacterium alkalicellulosilyticum TaxID=1912214 RepID=UPI000997341D|nr:aldehyde dehydrogenase [Bacillus alkalicellulosilyticus]